MVDVRLVCSSAIRVVAGPGRIILTSSTLNPASDLNETLVNACLYGCMTGIMTVFLLKLQNL